MRNMVQSKEVLIRLESSSSLQAIKLNQKEIVKGKIKQKGKQSEQILAQLQSELNLDSRANTKMNVIRRLFTRRSSSSSKPSRPDSPTNKVIKKILFYGFLFFTTATIVSKKYNTNLIFTFEPNDSNRRLIQQNAVFYQGTYFPTYWMFFGPLQRFYAKYLEEGPYIRPISEPLSKQYFETHSLLATDKYAAKENLPIAVIVAGWQGFNVSIKKLMLSTNTAGFRTVCIRPDDFHGEERLQKTIQKIKSQHPNSKIYGIGVDYGANLLVNLAAKQDKTFNGVVSIGNPLDLGQSQKKVQNANFIWKELLYKDMVKARVSACQQNKALLGQTVKLNPQTTNLYDIDRVCYNGGFEDYHRLKEGLSSINQIKNLKVPSLFFQSQQDPCYVSIEANEQKLQNLKCIFVESQRGGHTEWFESMSKVRWVARPIVHYLRLLHAQASS